MISRDALKSLDDGVLRTGPHTLHVDVTNGCNTDCITCWDHSPLLRTPRAAAWKRQRVDADAVADLLDDACDLGALRAVVISGMGEPFTHPDIYRMIADVKRRGLSLTVITNLIPADEDKVIALDVDQLLIGIHGASEAAYRAFHPSFRGDEWQRLHEKLEKLAAAGRRDKHVHVLCDVNADEVVDMVRLGKRYAAAQVNFKLASLREGTEACRAAPAQRARVRDDLLPAARAAAAELGVATNLDDLAAQLAAAERDEADTAPVADTGCYMGYAYARVLVDGTVLYCCNTEMVVGSLAGGARFGELWGGAAWEDARARMRRGEYLPSCAQCGKYWQNVKIGRAFEHAFGRPAMRR